MHAYARLTRLVAALFAVAAVITALAQPSAVGTVAPPMRADMTLNGSVIDARDSGDLATCQALCQGHSGCSGFTWSRSSANGKSICRRLTGALTDAAQAGVISCRMPCVVGAAALPVSAVKRLASPPVRTLAPILAPTPAPLLVLPKPVIVGTYNPPPAPRPPPPPPPPAVQTAPAPAGATAGRTGVFGYEVVQGPEANVAPLASTVVSAQCPEGKVALSAGFDFNATGDASVGLEMRGAIPEGRNAQVWVRNANIVNAAKARAYAVCVNTIAGLRVVDSTTESLDTVENPSRLSCGGRERLVGGGVMAGNDTLVNANAPEPGGERGTWLVSVIRSSPFAGQDMIRTRALCAPDAAVDGWEIIETATVYLDSPSNRLLLQGCPGNKVLLAGGVVRRDGPLLGLVVSSLRPHGPLTWAILIHNRNTITLATLQVVFAAVCARPQ